MGPIFGGAYLGNTSWELDLKPKVRRKCKKMQVTLCAHAASMILLAVLQGSDLSNPVDNLYGVWPTNYYDTHVN